MDMLFHKKVHAPRMIRVVGSRSSWKLLVHGRSAVTSTTLRLVIAHIDIEALNISNALRTAKRSSQRNIRYTNTQPSE